MNQPVTHDLILGHLTEGRRTAIGENVLVHQYDYENLCAAGFCPVCSEVMDESACRIHVDKNTGKEQEPFMYDTDLPDLWVLWVECRNARRVPGLVHL